MNKVNLRTLEVDLAHQVRLWQHWRKLSKDLKLHHWLLMSKYILILFQNLIVLSRRCVLGRFLLQSKYITISKHIIHLNFYFKTYFLCPNIKSFTNIINMDHTSFNKTGYNDITINSSILICNDDIIGHCDIDSNS